jgi:TonB family protein
MPDHPMPERKFPKSAASGRVSLPEDATLQGMSSESDLGELAALFAARSGGSFSAEFSADLALEIVLNEIVEQACLATGATGAAIILERDGEMVCRASSGINAPELGARLGSESGLTAECIKTRQVQRCDDAQADPRADAEASRSLGVRSVMILPLLRSDGLVGVLEIFSSQPGAFGERAEGMLEELAQRILKNLGRAHEGLSRSTITAPVATRNAPARPVSPIAATELEDSRPSSATGLHKEDEVPPNTPGRSPRAGLDVVTFALGAAVLVCAVLLATLVGLRLGWRKTTAVRGQVTKSAVDEAQPGTSAVSQPTPEAGNSMTPVSAKKNAAAPPSIPAVRSNDTFPPEGSLLVYENGKEVFRMPPSGEGKAASTKGTGGQSEMQRASATEPEIVTLSPEAAESSLLHRVEPEYPDEARQQGMQGAVVLHVRIDRDGAIQEVKLVSGQRPLAEAAIEAVKQWRFKPQTVNGNLVEMETTITLTFRLQR